MGAPDVAGVDGGTVTVEVDSGTEGGVYVDCERVDVLGAGAVVDADVWGFGEDDVGGGGGAADADDPGFVEGFGIALEVASGHIFPLGQHAPWPLVVTIQYLPEGQHPPAIKGKLLANSNGWR